MNNIFTAKTDKMEILGSNITIMVTDLDQSIKFYTETLGLSLKNRYGNHWADIEGAGISIGLHPGSEQGTRADNLQIGLRVQELEKAVAELHQKGVDCKIENDGAVRLAAFNDPDGNPLYLVQTR